MVGFVVVQTVLLGDEVELHRGGIRQDGMVKPNFLMCGVSGRFIIFEQRVVPREVELLDNGQQTGRISGTGGPTIGTDVLTSIVDVGAADEVGVARHRRELFDVVLNASDHRVIGAERCCDGDVLAAIPLLGLLVIDLASPVACLDAEQVVGVHSKFTGAVGALQASLSNAEGREQMRVQTTGLALLHHDGDEVFLIRLGRFSGSALPFQAFRDFGGDVGELALEVRAGANCIGIEAVHREGAVLIAGIGQLRDAVAAADVGAKVEQSGIRFIANVPVGSAAIVGDLDRDGTMVVPRAGRAPGTVCFVTEQADTTAGFDSVVCAHLARGPTDKSAESFKRCIAGHVMNGNLRDGLAAGTVAVGADGGIADKRGITHLHRLLYRWKVLRPFRGSEQHLYRTYSYTSNKKRALRLLE